LDARAVSRQVQGVVVAGAPDVDVAVSFCAGNHVKPGYLLLRGASSEVAGMSEHETPSTWRKSSFSQNIDCAEWSFTETRVYLRNSSDPSEHKLEFTYAEWRAFIEGVKSGEADLDIT
jgi:hypothetical protein